MSTLTGQVVVVDDMLHRVGYQCERCAQFVADVGEKLQLGIGGFFFQPAPHVDGSVDVDDEAYEQQGDDGEQQQVDFLMVVLGQIGVHTVVERVEAAALLVHLFALQQQHMGIVARDECPLEIVVALVGLMLQNVHGQLQHEVAAGGIDIGCLQPAVAYIFQSATRHGECVYAYKLDVLESPFLGCLPGPDGHAVVLSEHIVDVVVFV